MSIENFKGKYTEQERQKVIDLFLRKELRPGEKIVDNRDSKIAKELNLGLPFVSNTISNYLDVKYENWPPDENE